MMDSERMDAEKLARKLHDLLAAAKDRPFTVSDRAGIYILTADLLRALEQREAGISDHCRLSGCVHAAHGCPTWEANANPFATPPRDVPEAVLSEAVNRAIAAVEPMYGERQDTWIVRVREHARAMIAAAPSGEVG